MEDYDRVMKFLKELMKDKLYCEDNELFSKCMKYRLIEFMEIEEFKFMQDLYRELEYKND